MFVQTLKAAKLILQLLHLTIFIVKVTKNISFILFIYFNDLKIGVLGAEVAIGLNYTKQIEAKSQDENYIQKLKEDYINNSLSPYIAAENGLIDGIIFPEDTRKIIIKCLISLKHKVIKRKIKKGKSFR